MPRPRARSIHYSWNSSESNRKILLTGLCSRWNFVCQSEGDILARSCPTSTSHLFAVFESDVYSPPFRSSFRQWNALRVIPSPLHANRIEQTNVRGRGKDFAAQSSSENERTFEIRDGRETTNDEVKSEW